MSAIEANVIINVPDHIDISSLVQEIQSVVSNINGLNTHINVVQIDDPLSLSPGEFKEI
jgi:hypothetical protein